MSRTYTTVLLDCDGTLLNTIEDLAMAANLVCHEYGWPTFSVDEYKLKVGNGQRVLVERIIPESLRDDQELAEAAYQRYCTLYAAHQNDTTAPYDGILDMLQTLHKNGMQLGVLTNKNQAEAEALVQTYFPHLIDAVRGRTDNLPAKPDPAMTQSLLDMLHADASHAILLGDTRVDIACGRNADITTVGALWGFRSRQELEDAGADYIASHPRDLVRIIQEANNPAAQ